MKQGKRRVASRSDNTTRRNPYLIPALALVALSFLAYSNSFSTGFVLDNRGLILNDPRLREASPANIRLILDRTYWWPNGESGLYRPFTTLSYLFNYAVLGNRDQPAAYHIINFLLHAGNVLLAFALAVRFTRKLWTAFFIAALWSVHPVLTESVANIVGRADLLAAGAVLAALFTYLKSTETQGPRRLVWLFALIASTAIGVISKESAVVIPAVIVLYELALGRRTQWGMPQLMGSLATIIPIGLMLFKRASVLAVTQPMEIPFTDNPIAWADFGIARLTALKVIARYCGLLTWPANLSADYSWSQIPLAQGTPQDWIVALTVLAIVPATMLLHRWNRAAFFFFWLGLVSLAPAANLIFPIGTIMAERFLYLPALGFIACVVPAIYALTERAHAVKYAPIVLCIMTSALAARTWVRNADWHDDLSIATASVHTSPQSFKTHDLLANVLFASDPSHANIAQVIDESEKTLAILDPLPPERKPADPYRLGASLYMYREDYPKAIKVLLTLVAVEKARNSDTWLLLSSAYLATGNTSQASDAAAHARSLNPLNPQLYRVLADIASASGKLDDAAIALVEGAFITTDTSLRQALVELYRTAMDPKSCALTNGPRGPAINPACAVVHAHVCAASIYVVTTLAAKQQRELAQTRKRMFIEQFGCPKEPLVAALP